MSTKDQGPNQTHKQGGGQPGKEHAGSGQHQQHDEAPGQHTGGVGNRQDEPKTAKDAEKRAAEKAKKG